MKLYKYVCLSLTVLAIGACDGAKEQLGLEKKAPDEFQVVKRAPLELPPAYTLRPPAPGAPRPQEQETVEQARQTVFGEKAQAVQTAPTTSEGALLQQAGASQIDPGIRNRVDQESAELVNEEQPVIDKLLNIGSDAEPHSTVVDAEKEAERLRENQVQGKPVTSGETPSKDN